jgi:hypothetical protein
MPRQILSLITTVLVAGALLLALLYGYQKWAIAALILFVLISVVWKRFKTPDAKMDLPSIIFIATWVSGLVIVSGVVGYHPYLFIALGIVGIASA